MTDAPGNKKKGGSWIKKLALLLGAGVVMLAVLAVLAPRFVDWEKVRKAAEQEGTRALGREVRIKELKVSLLSGVEIGGFRIGGARGTDQPPLVTADRVVARYRLLPLLWLKVVINRIELDEPKLWVAKDARGKWSFADLAGGKAAAAPAAKVKPVVLPVGVDVETVRIMGAVMTYKDASAKPPLTVGVERLDVLLRNFSLSGALATLKVSCDAKMNGASIPVGVEGRLGIALDRSQLTLQDFAVTLPGIRAVSSGEVLEFQTLPTFKLDEDVTVDLAAVWSGYRGFLPKGVRDSMKPVGTAAVHVAVRGTLRRPQLEGTVQCKGIGVSMPDMPGALESLEGKVSFTSDTLTTADLRFLSLGSAFTVEADLKNTGFGAAATGAFNLAKWAPRGRFAVESPKVVLDQFLPPLDAKPADAKGGTPAPPAPEPDFRGMIPKGMDLDGTVEFREVVARKIRFVGLKGKVAIGGGNVSYDVEDSSYGGRQSAKGRVTLTRHPVEFEVEGKLTGWQVRPFLDDAVATFVAKSAEMQGRLTGTAEVEYRITGRGITSPALMQKTAGGGKFVAADGAVTKMSFFEKGLGKALKLGWLAKDLPFKTVGGSFTLGGGKLNTPDMTMDPGPDGDLEAVYNGSIGVVDLKLKGEMTTRFHPRHADEAMKGDVGKVFFIKEHDWAVGHWDVSGTAALPILLPSRKFLARKAKQEGVQEIKKLLPGAEDKGKNLLKGLLKKKK